MKIAAIDIGSNAIRLLISEAHPYKDKEVDFTKLLFLRIPLRLGFDVFQKGKISKKKQEQLTDSMQAFKMLMNVYQVDVYRACATSAMRDAKNGKALIKAIKTDTDIAIDIISGQEEATIIYNAHLGEKNNAQKTLLYIDVGGGSTELSLFRDNKLVQKESFNIGTIRLLQNQVSKAHWQELARFLKAISKKNDQVQLVGSGGNINKLFSLSKQKEGKPLSKATLSSYHDSLSAMSIEERMHHYDLREDRADVMVPALSIFLNIMEHMHSKEIFVPKIGLADGIVRSIYYQESL